MVSTIFRCSKIKTSKYGNLVTIIKSKLVIIAFGNHKIIKYCLFWGYYGVGKAALVDIEMVVFGPSLLIAYCGVFGGRGIVDVLKILRDLFRTLSFSFLEP